MNEYIQSGKNKNNIGYTIVSYHNPEINWEKGEMKMTQCPPICGKRKQKTQKKRQVRKIKEEKTVEELVPRRFWKWKKVFEKEELERIPTRKP